MDRRCLRSWSALVLLLETGCFTPDELDPTGGAALSSESGESETASADDSATADDGDEAADSADDGDDGMTSGNDPSSATNADADATADATAEGGSSESGDACGEIVCAHGMCINGTTCDCDEGWEGVDCSENVDDCAAGPCVNGACHDEVNGFTCQCDPAFEGELCDALAMPFCLVGSVTVNDAFDDVNGNPSTMAFEHLQGSSVDFALVFDVTDSYTFVNADEYAGPLGQQRVLEAEVLDFTFADAFMTDVYGAAFEGIAYDIVLVNASTSGVYFGNMVSPEGSEYWGWEAYTATLPIVVGGDGFPQLLPSEGSGSGSLSLRRYQNGEPLMTDYASSSWEMTLMNGVACEM